MHKYACSSNASCSIDRMAAGCEHTPVLSSRHSTAPQASMVLAKRLVKNVALRTLVLSGNEVGRLGSQVGNTNTLFSLSISLALALSPFHSPSLSFPLCLSLSNTNIHTYAQTYAQTYTHTCTHMHTHTHTHTLARAHQAILNVVARPIQNQCRWFSLFAMWCSKVRSRIQSHSPFSCVRFTEPTLQPRIYTIYMLVSV